MEGNYDTHASCAPYNTINVIKRFDAQDLLIKNFIPTGKRDMNRSSVGVYQRGIFAPSVACRAKADKIDAGGRLKIAVLTKDIPS
ncbi:MAG: hypothetical protein M3461_17250 [Pseudomonadota bacterium]|nr:hypothetical protein [Pseudomonadota bacterium]